LILIEFWSVGILCVVFMVPQILLVVIHSCSCLTTEAWGIILGCGCGCINSLFCRIAVPEEVIYVPPSGRLLHVSSQMLK